MRRLEAFEGELPAKRLVGLWSWGFGVGKGEGEGEGEEGGKGEKKGEGEGGGEGKGQGDRRIEFAMEKAREMSGVMRGVGALDREFLVRMWRWVEGLVGGG